MGGKNMPLNEKFLEDDMDQSDLELNVQSLFEGVGDAVSITDILDDESHSGDTFSELHDVQAIDSGDLSGSGQSDGFIDDLMSNLNIDQLREVRQGLEEQDPEMLRIFGLDHEDEDVDGPQKVLRYSKLDGR